MKKTRFIVGVFGGLASQMNKFAFMLFLQKHYPTVEVLMARGCDWQPYEHNGYELDRVFGLEWRSVDKAEVAALADFYPGRSRWSRFRNFVRLCEKKIYGPRGMQVTLPDPTEPSPWLRNLDVSRTRLFWGDWPDVLLHDVDDEMRSAFVFKQELDETNRTLALRMQQCNSVSIHVRRGDYFKYGFPILGNEYYKKAVSEIEQRVANPVYFVFSDDLKLAADALSFINCEKIFVDNNRGMKSHVDMRLMSLCKHNINANSGFSYWGAWLNENPRKIVVGPSMHVPWCKNPVTCKGWLMV